MVFVGRNLYIISDSNKEFTDFCLSNNLKFFKMLIQSHLKNRIFHLFIHELTNLFLFDLTKNQNARLYSFCPSDRQRNVVAIVTALPELFFPGKATYLDEPERDNICNFSKL